MKHLHLGIDADLCPDCRYSPELTVRAIRSGLKTHDVIDLKLFNGKERREVEALLTSEELARINFDVTFPDGV